MVKKVEIYGMKFLVKLFIISNEVNNDHPRGWFDNYGPGLNKMHIRPKCFQIYLNKTTVFTQ